MLHAVPILNGAGDTGFEAGIKFDNLKPLIERNDSTYRSSTCCVEELIRTNETQPLIVPSRISDALVVPNFFVEAWVDDSNADGRKDNHYIPAAWVPVRSKPFNPMTQLQSTTITPTRSWQISAIAF